jgi:mono/diheme cytochrome c family protein
MKNLLVGMVVALCSSASVDAQMGMRHGAGMHHGGMQMSMVRHHFVMQHGIDAQYASRTMPLEPTTESIDNGKRLYEQNCATCHGPAGDGDGPAGAALSPPPANVALAAKMPIATDAYLYWTIAEGGVPVESAMPPFKAALGEGEIWDIIGYLRQL